MDVLGCVWVDVSACSVSGNTSSFGSICAGIQACVCGLKKLLPVLMHICQVLFSSTFSVSLYLVMEIVQWKFLSTDWA